MKTIQLLEDDLRFASESIQTIATQAIQSIERLYSKRFVGSGSYDNCTIVQTSTQQSPPKSHEHTQEDIESAIFSRFENHENLAGFTSSTNPNLKTNMQQISPMLKSDPRPDLVDDNLHNLNL